MNKMRFMVCPHDTAKNPERWFVFAQYLSRHMEGGGMVFSPSIDFADFHQELSAADVVYANPQDTYNLCKEHDYQLLARPSNLFDEAVIVATESEASHQLSDLESKEVLSVMSMLPTCIALSKLDAEGVQPAGIRNKDSWLAVMNGVRRGEAPYGFIYKDFFDGLNTLSQSAVNIVDTTSDGQAFHSLVVSPRLADKMDQLRSIVMRMHEDEVGAKVLAELGIVEWLPVGDDALERVAALRGHCNAVACLDHA